MTGRGDTQSDDDLVRAAAAGDVSAFETLYFRHRDFVYRVALRHAREHEAALDASQEVFAYLLKKLPTLRITGKLSTFLYPVAKNTALAARQRAERRLKLAQSAAEESQVHDPLSSDPPNRARLLAAVDALPDPQREVLLMRIVDEMSVEEVAAALEIPVGTVKSRLHHALGVLRADEHVRSFFGQE